MKPAYDIEAIIVDDSESIRSVMQAILEKQSNIATLSHASGQETLSYINKRPSTHTLIFIDLNMPDMDGMELIRHLGHSGFKGGVIIFSKLEKRIIDLACEVARQNQIHLISSLAKPITEENVNTLLEKFYAFIDRMNTPSLNLSIKDIQKAIKEKQITPYYQPKLDIKTQKVVGIELLARITIPGTTDSIQAGRFIPIADSCGLINTLSLNLFDKALAEFKAIKQAINQNLKLSINLSPKQLGDLSSIAQIDQLFEQHKISTQDIIIEVTEEDTLKAANQLETLNRLKMNGYGVALDDFGTGFTNLNQLKTLPLTEVKIDRSIISNINIDPFSQIVTNTLIDLSKELNFQLTTEGIENINELKYLEDLNAELTIQGYIISKPKPKDEFIRWYKAFSKGK